MGSEPQGGTGIIQNRPRVPIMLTPNVEWVLPDTYGEDYIGPADAES